MRLPVRVLRRPPGQARRGHFHRFSFTPKQLRLRVKFHHLNLLRNCSSWDSATPMTECHAQEKVMSDFLLNARISEKQCCMEEVHNSQSCDHHEHAAELALVKMCEQPLRNTRWMTSCNDVLVVVASRFALSARTFPCPHSQLQCARFFLASSHVVSAFLHEHRPEVALVKPEGPLVLDSVSAVLQNTT